MDPGRATIAFKQVDPDISEANLKVFSRAHLRIALLIAGTIAEKVSVMLRCLESLFGKPVKSQIASA